MATRVQLPAISIPELRRSASWQPALPADPKTAVWRLATAPWWLWSDMPALPYPARNPKLPRGGLAGEWVVSGIDRIATRIWIQRAMAIVARGIWLTILIGCLWLIVDLIGGPVLNIEILLGIGIALLLCSLAVAGLSRPTRAQVARMLDRSFVLHERIATALGNIGVAVPGEGEPVDVVYLQVADAANAITVAQENASFRLRPPVRELVMAIALGLAFAALAFARGTGGGIPPTESNVVPAFVPAAERFVQPEIAAQPPDTQDVPTVEEVEAMMQTSITNQEDLRRLADALADHALTSEAADLIDRGLYGAAAEELRDVSSQAGELSDQARADLASDLSQAAAEMSDGNKTLSETTQEAAEGLEQGGEAAQNGIRDLANAVEQSGQQVQSSEALDQAMQQAQEHAAANASQQSDQSSAGNEGLPSPNDSSGNSSESNPSSASGSQPGNPGESSSDSGAEAEAGIGDDSMSSSGKEGDGAPAESNAPSDTEGAPGDSSAQQPGGGTGSPSDDTAEQTDATEGDSSTGSGAGGESNQDASNPADGSGGENEHQTDGKKDPSAPKVSDGTGEGDDASGAGADPHKAIELPRSPEGQSISIGGNSGASSSGSGAGVTVSSGSTEQGEVGEAGPDSNHVPPEYRSIVENYFSDQDDG